MACTVDKVLDVALGEVGYLEKRSNSNLDSKTGNAGYNNYTKYARDFDEKYPNFYNGRKQSVAWCDIFVDWCFVKAYGVDKALKLLGQPLKSCGAGCYFSMNYFKQIGCFSTTPKAGDQIFFYNSSRSDIAHTGLVYKVDSNYVYTVEGNTSSASGVVANGGAVAKKSYSRSYSRIAGYGRPKYDVETSSGTTSTPTVKPTTPSTPTASTVNKIDTVAEVQKWANTNYKSGLEVDGDYGAKTKKALVKILQTELNQTYKSNLTVDGVFGDKTKAACPTLQKGFKNDVVGVLQALLICNGYSGAYLDKDYGSATVAAVKSYQSKKGLTVDGIAGKNTFAKLCS